MWENKCEETEGNKESEEHKSIKNIRKKRKGIGSINERTR